jgi:hypothetical protein
LTLSYTCMNFFFVYCKKFNQLHNMCNTEDTKRQYFKHVFGTHDFPLKKRFLLCSPLLVVEQTNSIIVKS